MTGVDLKPFVGKKAVVQLAPGLVWMVAQEVGGAPRMMVVGGQEGGVAGTPFIECDVIDGGESPPRLRVKLDNSKRYVEVQIAADAIFAVTVVGDPIVHEPLGGGLIRP